MGFYEDDEMTPDERREYRRQRRIRNQVLAYVGLVVTLAAVTVGGIFLARFLSGRINEQKQKDEIEEQISQMEEEEEEVVVEQVEEEVVEYTEEDLLEEVVDSCIAAMTLEEKVAGLFFVTPEAITGVGTAVQAGEGTKEALEQYPVGGLIYFADNIQSESQITEMLANTMSYSKYPIFLGVDEEGGKVARLAEALDLENVGPMAQVGSGGDPGAAYNAMQTVASYLTKYGFNVDFAPVADILTNEDNTALGDRTFGGEESVVSSMVPSAVAGLEDSNITACLKHFPGLGEAGKDTHETQAVIEISPEELRARELKPFIAGIEGGARMIMVTHAAYPQITGDNTPATMSDVVITDILRNELGYNGVVITDAMNMGAITEYYGADEAAIKALRAGADMILMPEDFELAYEGVLAAVLEGTISEERINDSLARVYRIKYEDTVGVGEGTGSP